MEQKKPVRGNGRVKTDQPKNRRHTPRDKKHTVGKPSPYYSIFYLDEAGTIENEAEWARLAKFVERGLADSHIATVYNISLQTFKEWKHRHRKFAAVIDETKRHYDNGMVVRSLFEQANGYKVEEQKPIVIKNKIHIATYEKHILPNQRAIETWLYNRQPDQWKPHQHLDQVPPPPPPKADIDLSQMSAEDLKEFERLLTKYSKPQTQ